MNTSEQLVKLEETEMNKSLVTVLLDQSGSMYRR